MKIIVCDNHHEASKYVAEIFIKQVQNKPNSVLGLATGSTPIEMYYYLIKDHKLNNTSYRDVITINLDEYVKLEASNSQSYHYFMEKHLFSGIDINKSNTFIPDGTGDINANIKAYNDLLENINIDIQLLGIGRNCHIGFNEPDDEFQIGTHLVNLKQSTIDDNARLFFDGDYSLVPKQAITVGVKAIMSAKQIILLATGKQKAQAISNFLNSQINPQFPASILHAHNNVVLVLDKGAASLIGKDSYDYTE